MPKIKVYKYGSTVIPIANASVATAYESRWNDCIYPNKREYITHLKTIRQKIRKRNVRNKLNERMDTLWNESESFQDVIKWVENNNHVIFEKTAGMHRPTRDNANGEFEVKLTYLQLVYSNSVSNSHSAPKGKRTNFGRYNEDYPSGFPGWNGRIEFEIKNNRGISGSDVGKLLRLHTGTGGGLSGGLYGYDVRVFEEDWPGMQEIHTFRKLADDKNKIEINYGTRRY